MNIEKCFSLLTTKHFKQVDSDPTKTLESNIQRSLRKLKPKVSPFEYKKSYPTGSCPGNLYGTAKLHKLPVNGKIDDLPIRPVVSNINSATYHLVKHLAKVQLPYIYQKYKRLHSANKEPARYEMVSFGMKSLFTNVLLYWLINITLRRIYDYKELETSKTSCKKKEMLTLCTKNVYFTYYQKIVVQPDGVTKGSLLGCVLANIFVIEL